MGYRYIDQTERIALWLCKSLNKPGAEIEMGEVPHLVAQMERRQVHGSPSWRQGVRLEAKDVPNAVQLALSRGWLEQQDGRLSITRNGAAAARRSRASPRKKRQIF